MGPDFGAFILQASLPQLGEITAKALQGDVTTITLLGIGAIVCFVLLILLVELMMWFIGPIKRFFVILLLGIFSLLFLSSLAGKILAESVTPIVFLAGTIGAIFVAISVSIALLSFKKEWLKPKEKKIAGLKSEMKKLVAEQYEEALEGQKHLLVEPKAVQQMQSQQPEQKETFSKENILLLFKDDSALAFLSYLFAIEAGAICSIQFAVQDEAVGLTIFAIFLIAAMVFIKSTYQNYLTGLKRLLAALLLGAIFSIALSNAWLNTPLEQLLSLAFFKTSAPIALMIGIAAMLLIESKGQ